MNAQEINYTENNNPLNLSDDELLKKGMVKRLVKITLVNNQTLYWDGFAYDTDEALYYAERSTTMPVARMTIIN